MSAKRHIGESIMDALCAWDEFIGSDGDEAQYERLVDAMADLREWVADVVADGGPA